MLFYLFVGLGSPVLAVLMPPRCLAHFSLAPIMGVINTFDGIVSCLRTCVGQAWCHPLYTHACPALPRGFVVGSDRIVLCTCAPVFRALWRIMHAVQVLADRVAGHGARCAGVGGSVADRVSVACGQALGVVLPRPSDLPHR